ncbi:MAG TPA: DUF2891 family protein [Candidatus Eisenbacteria bacterium]|nr:DUF2891 family protein [Candidatus Eisenbacteria bacterium]
MAVPAPELAPFVRMALDSVVREFPVHLPLVLEAGEAPARPRELTPAFFGSFDWHSAVHGHWCLARAARLHPEAAWAAEARAALARSLTPANLGREHGFLDRHPAFERPYGLAWLLQLAAELRAWRDDEAARWHGALAPLEALAAERLVAWAEQLPCPVRSGEHAQSAFALALLLDWTRDAGRHALRARAAARAVALYGADREAPVGYEPSAYDFLSPLLAEADLLRRVLAPESFADWLREFLPPPGAAATGRWLAPVSAADPADGKFAHWSGLNLSRAWMLEGIAAALSSDDPRRGPLAAAAAAHRAAGLAGAHTPHYAGSHWLGSFAVYLLTGRGLR